MNPYEDDGYYDDNTEYEARMAYREERELDYDPTEDDELSVYDPDSDSEMYGVDPPDAEEWE